LNLFSLNSTITDIRDSFYNLKLDVTDVGVPVDLKYFNTGSQDILALATSQGLIVGIDTRCSTPIFRFKNDLNHRKENFYSRYLIDYSFHFRLNHRI
jgi:hypothetical protein